MRFPTWTVLLALLVAVLLSYGIYIPWFGLYGDDWLYLYNYHLLGPGSFASFVAIDRPYSAWVYELTTPIFGVSAWPYHLYLLLLRWLSAVLLWYVLRLAWPQAERPAAWTALLFAVYPGFQQQPIAVQYILHFSVLDCFLLSLITMMMAQQPSKKPLTAWLLMAISLASGLAMFSMEYFVGLELLRPVLLWLILRPLTPALGQRLKRMLFGWLPYLFLMVGFFVWRVWIFKFPTYQPELVNNLRTAPVAAVLHLARRGLVDFYKVVPGAWLQALSLPSQDTQRWGAVALLIFSLALFAFYLYRLKDESGPLIPAGWLARYTPRQAWSLEALGVGIIALAMAGWPFWIAGVALELSFPWDRSTLPFMLGASLVVAALIELVLPRYLRPFSIALLLGLAIGLHYQNALVYRGEWQALRQYFWQLTWRAPNLLPGTIIASDSIPLFRFSDNDLTPLLNWSYAPQHHDRNIPYKYFDLSLRLGTTLPEVKKDLPIRHGYRNLMFTGNSSNLLIVFNQPGGCLWVLRPGDTDFPGLPETIQDTLPLSNLRQIATDSASPARPPANLGTEPPYNWCYYFEKADLARQQRNWEEVVRMAEAAQGLQLRPNDPSEWLPFIEGYANQGQIGQAVHLSELVGQYTELHPMLCLTWKRIQKSLQLDPEADDTLKTINQQYHCTS